MVRKTFTRKKLNSEKGVTGVDIVVSITMIVITIAVVMAIYTNISSTSREVNRTSGATRMATNIVENIELMYYEEFLAYLRDSLVPKTYVVNGTTKNIYSAETVGVNDYNGTYLIPGESFTAEKFFETKIPTGYTLKLVVSNVYGDTVDTQYDFVRKVDVSILFNASGREKEVSLSTTKAFERLTSICNEHQTDKKYFKFGSGDETKYNSKGVSYVKSVGSGVYKTVASLADIGSYKYEDTNIGQTNPIMMIINHSDNVKNDGTVIDEKENQIFIWIPSHIYDASTNKFIYEYETTELARATVDKINKVDNVPTSFYTVDARKSVLSVNSGFAEADGTRLSGVWMKVEKLNSIGTGSSQFEVNCKRYWTQCVGGSLK